MFFQSRARYVSLVVLAAAVMMLVPMSLRVAAQKQTQTTSIESVIYDLKSPDAGRRQAAVRQIGVVKYVAATSNLVAMTNDPVADVRREVELTLERLGDMEGLPGFIAFTSDTENDIRSRAVAELVNIHLTRPAANTSVLNKLTKIGDVMMRGRDRDDDVVVEPDVPVSPAVIDALRGRLGDSERGIRRTAIRGLGILRGRVTVPDLLQILREDRDESMRFDALRAIRKIDDRSIAGDLVSLLNINGDLVRNELMGTLGAMRFRGAVVELTRIVEQAPKTDLPRVLALAALADIGDPTSMPLFEQLKADKNEWMRLHANEGIARTANSTQKSAISAARLVEKSPLVRTAQAFALLRIGESEYLDELVRALDRANTRELAKEYLLETRPADRQALFAPRSAGSAARAELAEVFGRIGDPNALPRLQELAHDSDDEVARAAERATRRLAVVTPGGQDR